MTPAEESSKSPSVEYQNEESAGQRLTGVLTYNQQKVKLRLEYVRTAVTACTENMINYCTNDITLPVSSTFQKATSYC